MSGRTYNPVSKPPAIGTQGLAKEDWVANRQLSGGKLIHIIVITYQNDSSVGKRIARYLQQQPPINRY